MVAILFFKMRLKVFKRQVFIVINIPCKFGEDIFINDCTGKITDLVLYSYRLCTANFSVTTKLPPPKGPRCIHFSVFRITPKAIKGSFRNVYVSGTKSTEEENFFFSNDMDHILYMKNTS